MASIVINGSGDIITREFASTPDIPHLRAISMAGWVKLDSGQSADRLICGAKNAADHSGTDGNCYVRNFGSTTWYITRPATVAAFDTALPDSEWIYVAIAYGTTYARGWWWDADGVLGGSVETTDVVSEDVQPYCIGVGAEAYFRANQALGKYAHWKVWNAELSQANFEAQQFEVDWVVGTSNKYSGFADDGTDTSGNSKDWTLSGTSTDSDTPPVSSGSTAATKMAFYRMLRTA